MSTLDWIFVVVVLGSLLLGAWRGLVNELMSLAGWLAAFVLAGAVLTNCMVLQLALEQVVPASWRSPSTAAVGRAVTGFPVAPVLIRTPIGRVRDLPALMASVPALQNVHTGTTSW